ncbi:hypothetical protein COT44_00190 [Candidatus Shapirobacteria bacterium CG08_land_8_20_14_0_20_39_18]|uniref:Uncharacterized protein n=1 Tax=Candidatus Shapirobacteria bacterium CG08_land_8_20_14_0_20_39_18 TaxID=1974883 RepID=A0A2M6XE18_9BACT|nr:MAG: hypothetical protein COT44_00190 [Candidatus Shapirobacteria bacterium CG08_land_8_20_14_0_20_39_18]PIY64687.1 MAG: hypothetical protein COY91_04430 [Candidatus Shapirobacteria bacterium CG_4_10_14_0_8_um_filter_39_15]PJE68139.1 MAG: hypothetical protein COU94_03455 [Candidatus Shapirobacteria bacterium CG10_big_fil_rev_8_21_14_0_10_38_8]
MVERQYLESEVLGKWRWWICPNCGRRNKLDRKRKPTVCAKCGISYINRSFWPEKIRRWILDRDRHSCAIRSSLFSRSEEVGPCEGVLQVIHLFKRQHGGNLKDPRNGITVCLAHADLLTHGRRRARGSYTQDQDSFGQWHQEFLYVSFARLPKLIQYLIYFLAGVANERTRIAQKGVVS